MKVRVKFSKYGVMRFIGHLDVMHYFQKAIRRAGIDIAFSEGFSPHQIMSFASPLSVGHTSEGEYFDMEVNSCTDEADLMKRLRAVMAEGIDILDAAILPENAKNAMASVEAASYLTAFYRTAKLPSGWQERLVSFFAQEHIPVVKRTKKGEKTVDLKEGVYELQIRQNLGSEQAFQGREPIWEEGVCMLLNASSGGNIKPSFVLEQFFRTMDYELSGFDLMVHRLETFQDMGTENHRKLVPLIWEK